MIGKLKGIVDSFGDDWVIVDVGGVGYQVYCSARTLQRLPRAARSGLPLDRNLRARGHDPPLRLRIGYGARMVPPPDDRPGRRRQGRARGVVGARSRRAGDRHRHARPDGDLRAPGVGKRVAERIAGELKDKAPAFSDADPACCGPRWTSAIPGPAVRSRRQCRRWFNLGYPQIQAAAAVTAAARAAGEDAPTETLIRSD